MTTLALPRPIARSRGATGGPVDPNAHRRVRGTLVVFLVGATAAALASVWTVRHGTNMDYGDARAHLAIARRVFDSKAPGLAQLGSVWLPVPHLLLLPLVANFWMFETGVAGCVLGSLCLGASCAALWRITARLGLATPGRVAGILVLIANPSLLYVSSTALTEPVLVACVLCTIAGLSGWAFSERQLSGGELAVFAGLPAALGVLTRYEAWALALAGVLFIVIVARRRGHAWRRCLVWAAALAAPSALAVAWWLAYNTAVFGNPLEFLNGDYAAAAFTEVFEREGQLTTKGNLGMSTAVYGRALVETAGLAPLVLAASGLLVTCWRGALTNRALVLWLGGATSAFLMFSLVTGQHIMVNEASLPPGAYNNRYVLSAIPWVALLVAVSISAAAERLPRRLAATGLLVATLAVAAQNAWWAQDPVGRMTILTEAANQHADYVVMRDVAHWLRDHYDGGDVLMDQTPADFTLAPDLGVPLHEVYTRSVGDLFTAAVVDPYEHARWVVMHRTPIRSGGTDTERDLVSDHLALDPQFHARYRLVHAQGNIGIYRRADG